MSRVEMTIKEEADGIQLVGKVYETDNATQREKDIAKLLADALMNFTSGLEKYMNRQQEEKQ